MERVRVELGAASYDILNGTGLASDAGTLIAAILGPSSAGRACALVTNERIGPLHAAGCMDALRRAGFRPVLVSLPDGEEHKTLATVNELWQGFLQAGLERGSTVVAL